MMKTNDKFLLKNLALILFGICILSSSLASIIHYLSPDPQPISLIIPPAISLINISLLVLVYKDLIAIEAAFRFWLITSFAGIAIPIYFFLLKVTLSENLKLSQELPPVAPILLLIHIVSTVFIRPNEVLRIGVYSWLLIALPILSYLVTHPSDLFTARGTELFLFFGPAVLCVGILFKFNKIINDKLIRLDRERENLQRQSEQDPLTRLWNRRGIRTRIDDLITTNKSAAYGVVLFDIDHFKQINDRYGHDVGDRVLCEVAQRCQDALQDNALIGRWGGEEFLVFIQSFDSDAGSKVFDAVAEQLRLAISSKPIGNISKVTASFGVASLVLENPFEISFKYADEAMYMAKRQGRNRVVRFDNVGAL